jgi:tetratricopeptide (TPR) repeat protein
MNLEFLSRQGYKVSMRCNGRSMVCACAALFFSFGVFAQGGSCGELRSSGQYGPYDFRKDHDKLPIVLGAHFTPEVETLIRGKSSTIGADIDYTLRAIPNYHRALIAMMRLGEKEKKLQPNGSRYTIECWFERAIVFTPDDAIVRMIYSTYLSSKGRIPEANGQLDAAVGHAKDNPFTHYNIGLHYFDIKNYQKALFQAHKAIALGFAQTALMEQLSKVGKWSDPIENVLIAPKEAESGTNQSDK